MAENRTGEQGIKKDQHGSRDVRREVEEETRSGAVKPTIGQPNRDRSRGDWDRTGNHHDEDPNRAPVDEGE